MNRKPKTSEQVRAEFQRRGKTFSSWAKERGYDPAEVSRVLNGLRRGHRGKCHEIAVALGLKVEEPDYPEALAA